MVKLIQKCGYIKNGGRANGYMKYIATREGVEIVEGTGKPTENQVELIRNILRDFPEAGDSFEYADYIAAPSQGSASAFISAALDYNAHSAKSQDIYMRYIATRPRVEKHGEHGLFGVEDRVDLSSTLHSLQEHNGNVWTLIYSLRREDAARLGYDNAESWRRLILSHQAEMADAMKISPENFRWYAAFHDEGHHPHIHMMVWSDDPKQGYLTEDGIETMRSKLTNAIFKDEMYSLYVQKDISYKDLKAAARNTMRELLSQMDRSICSSPVIEQRMTELVHALDTTKGKKQYGYLKKPVKEIVDAIVDELAQQPAVAQCYEAWNKIRDELESYYKDKPREHLPLSQQKEFRAIKNMVIQEAENIRLGVHTFEDERMRDEPETAVPYAEEEEPDRRLMRDVIYEDEDEWEDEPKEKPAAVKRLEELWRRGYSGAAHMLGKLYRDGKDVQRDLEMAEQWFSISARGGNNISEYVLGKMLLDQGRECDGYRWIISAANHGNTYAMYRIAKDLLSEGHPAHAVEYFQRAAQRGNQYAQYALGKLYLQGTEDIPRDKEEALRWLELSAAQGNPYAQYLVDHADDGQNPSILLSATRLLHHMSRIFRDNSVAPANPQGLRIDSRRRRYLQEKRIAMGHKPDDHEEYVPTQNWQQTM